MVRNHLFGILLLLVVNVKINSQASFIDYPQVCDFIYTDDDGLIYLSSTRGLYLYDGSGKPKRIKLEGLDNSNIQSSIYPDADQGFWFTTYNRLVRYDKLKGTTESYQVVVSPGDSLISNYYIFDIDDERTTIYIKHNEQIYEHNTVTKETRFIIDSISGKRIVSTHLNETIVLLDSYYSLNPSIVFLEGNKSKSLRWVNWPERCMAQSMFIKDSNTVFIGTNHGLFSGDIRRKKVQSIRFKEFDSGILAIEKYKDQSWIISTKDKHLFVLKVDSSNGQYSINELRLFPAPGQVNRIFRNSNGTIFLSSYDVGIYYFNPENIKFSNYGKEDLSALNIGNSDQNIIKNLCRENEITASGIPFIDFGDLMLTSLIPYRQSIINEDKVIEHPNGAQLYRYFKDHDEEVYASFLDTTIYKYETNTWRKVITPPAIDSYVNLYFNVGDTLHLASVDQEKIVTWTGDRGKGENVKTFTGEVFSALYAADKKSIYLGTEQGLLQYTLQTQTFSLVDSSTTMPCFCALQDKDGNIWYSSSHQILKYSPVIDSMVYFDLTDGTREFSGRKCTALSSDSLLFYYSGGFTLIEPSKVNPINSSCHINFLNLKINDVLQSYSAVINYMEQINKEYKDNTISFDLIGNDLIDAVNTRLKYTLKGYDQDWIYSDGNAAFVRYPRLPPGSYVFTAFGANSDGIWNAIPREIFITIHPPFWLTWWFISLLVIAVAGIGYWAVKSYYQRKLEKKNQLLREQTLIIEKQQAVEHERTRIASEMHDDLGSGLTTIRYLSDKALTQAKDAEEAIQIKKIADHSNDLVRNMSEIIWAMNARFDNADSLTSYLRRYASEYLESYNLPLNFTASDEALDQIPLSGERRRNIFLVFKETLHNTIKYSGASAVHVNVTTGDNFMVHITEVGGKGFDPDVTIEKGNGIYNSRKRLTAIGGEIRYESTPEAMHIILSIPLQTTHNVQT